jgi:hypothetical protein
MVIAGLSVDRAVLKNMTTDYLRLKQVYYPRSAPRVNHLLDYILAEIKATDLRRELRSTNRDDRRHAIGYLDRIIELLLRYGARAIGRIWVKQPGTGLDPASTYTYAIQDIARHFEHQLAATRTAGLMICDSRMHNQDREVSHSVFTMKQRHAGDPLPHLVESPVFGNSDNHSGLQLADLLAGAFLFPMACRTYCQGCLATTHMSATYDQVKSRYAVRLHALQYIYQTNAGRTGGGIVVSDRRGRRPSRDLFSVPAVAQRAGPARPGI